MLGVSLGLCPRLILLERRCCSQRLNKTFWFIYTVNNGRELAFSGATMPNPELRGVVFIRKELLRAGTLSADTFLRDSIWQLKPSILGVFLAEKCCNFFS